MWTYINDIDISLKLIGTGLSCKTVEQTDTFYNWMSNLLKIKKITIGDFNFVLKYVNFFREKKDEK